MSLSYTLRESLSGFRRARVSTGFAVLTLWIALVLLGLFAIVSVNTQRVVQSLRNRVEMEAFLREPVTGEELRRIERSILSVPGVDSIQYVSKEEAARVFEREFGDNVYRVLNFNPLPPSIKISLKNDYKTSERARALDSRFAGIAGIDTVVYRRRLLEIIDARMNVVNSVTLGLGMFIMLSAVLLVANTIRLAIYAKRHIIRTMELVGATAMFIRWPFLIEGMIQGLLGGGLAAVLLYLAVERLTRLLSEELAAFVHMPSWFYVAVVAGGLVLGLFGSIVSVSRFLRSSLNR
jgi:cell division transport system permease protein